jgi:hypothetical protein
MVFLLDFMVVEMAPMPNKTSGHMGSNTALGRENLMRK